MNWYRITGMHFSLPMLFRRQRLKTVILRDVFRCLLRQAILATALLSLPPAGAEQVDGAALQLPSACTVNVHRPARALTATVDYIAREASSRFDITPAVLTPHTVDIEIRQAATDYRVEAATFSRRYQHVELEPERIRWVRDSVDGELPLSTEELARLTGSGIDAETVPLDTCVHEIYLPPIVETETLRLLVRAASARLDVSKPQFERTSRRIEIAPAYDRLVEVPTVFTERQRRVAVSAGDTDRSVRYETVDVEQVQTPAMITRVREPAKTRHITVELKRADAVVRRVPTAAQYATIVRPIERVSGSYRWVRPPELASVASEDGMAEARITGRVACRRLFPARTHRFERITELTPARAIPVPLPAITRKFDVERLRSAASATRVAVPELRRRRAIEIGRAPARIEQYAVPCRESLTRPRVRRLQRALLASGFSPGPIDGVFGRATRRAMRRFQTDQGLFSGAGLTRETLDRLAVAQRSALSRSR